MNYRSEVDGLRAVAVLPVLLFHAGFPLFSGGFVGVDVFFVISGYLITRVIHEEMQLDKFSIVNFYERRIRRLFPALVLVSLVCVPFAWLWMLPGELKDFGESLVAVNFFASNVLFWLETDYFAAVSELKPLLHTWSLAVEEQFYLVFPLLLLAMQGFRHRLLMLIILGLCGVSLALAEVLGRVDQSANFYLLPTRAWELGVGVALALNIALCNRMSVVLRNTASLAGLIMICGAILLFDESVLFPGVAALVPTLGTVLILAFARQDTLVGRLLSLRGVVLIGLISYSAYLWHQPIYAFARLRLPQEPSAVLMVGLGLLALILAYLTWRFVEAPFRDRKRFSSKQIFSMAGITWLLLVTTGAALHLTDGAPQRNAEAKSIDHRIRHNRGLGRLCTVTPEGEPNCQVGDAPELVIWGDSYAKHLVPGFLASADDPQLVQFSQAGCGPIPGVTVVSYPRFTEAWGDECIAQNKTVMDWLEQNAERVTTVVIGSPFINYLADGRSIYTKETGLMPVDRNFVTETFLATLSHLRKLGIEPMIFAPPLKTGENIGACLKRRAFLKLPLDACDLRAEAIDELADNARVREFLQAIDKDFRVVWLPEMMCTTKDCPSHLDGLFYYRDWGHLTVEASEYLGNEYGFYDMATQ